MGEAVFYNTLHFIAYYPDTNAAGIYILSSAILYHKILIRTFIGIK
jgi:hypothetical protein